MKRNLLKTFLAVGILTTVYQFSAPAFAGEGNGSDGGNFAFEDYAITNIKKVTKELARTLKYIPESEFKTLSKEFNTSPEMKKDELIQIIQKVDINEGGESYAVDSRGRKRYRDLYYNDKDRSIIALQLFLSRYNDSALLSNEQKRDLQIRLLHEATHLFGIGRTLESNSDSRKLALKIMEKVEDSKKSYPHISDDVFPFKNGYYYCGSYGEIHDRIADCEIDKANNWATASMEIHESLWEYRSISDTIATRMITELSNPINNKTSVTRYVHQIDLNQRENKVVYLNYKKNDIYYKNNMTPEVYVGSHREYQNTANRQCIEVSTHDMMNSNQNISNFRLPSVKELQDLFLVSKYVPPYEGCFWSNEKDLKVCLDGSVQNVKKTGFLNIFKPVAYSLCIGSLK